MCFLICFAELAAPVELGNTSNSSIKAPNHFDGTLVVNWKCAARGYAQLAAVGRPLDAAKWKNVKEKYT
jgi:hypothetical protein